jgi:cytochrome P450
MTTGEKLANRPAHIPDSAVYDFDIFHDTALLKDPHKRALELVRDAPPVFWTPRNGGHWMAIRYEEAHFVSRETDTFSSSPLSPEQRQALAAAVPPGIKRLPQLTPIVMDPPEHTKFRLPLQRAFAPKTINNLKEDIAALANHLVDAVIEQGACDFIPAVAEQLPVRVFLKMMGLPAERLTEFRALVREVFAPNGNDMMVQFMRLRRIVDAMMDVILARRTDPKEDLISALWALEVDGEPMTIELMEDYAALLFLAGLDTVVNAIGFGMRHLAANPDLQNELRTNPQLIPEATEELLRRYTFTIPIRRVLKDTELGGRTLKTGDLVILYFPAADLDAQEFPSPERFDVARENKVHMAFGVGPHRCLGSHLARLELQTLYRVVLERLPPFRLDAGQPVKFHAGQILAVASLPLRWN